MLRLDATTQFWGITADGVDGELDRVLSELIAAVEQVAAHGPTERELAAQRQGRELTSSTAERIVEHLDAAARLGGSSVSNRRPWQKASRRGRASRATTCAPRSSA